MVLRFDSHGNSKKKKITEKKENSKNIHVLKAFITLSQTSVPRIKMECKYVVCRINGWH